MSKISRRDSLKYITVAGLSTSLITGCEPEKPEAEGHEHQHESLEGLRDLSPEDIELLKQKFFTDQERETVRVLANLIIPADGRSGNAEEAGAVEFIEFMMLDQPERFQVPIRGGLKWLDLQALERFEKSFIDCTEDQQKNILDDIAYPDTAPPEMSQGVAFFNKFRDLVATGFWTSLMGIEDLEYTGNRPTAWNGAPQEWLDRLGVSYEEGES